MTNVDESRCMDSVWSGSPGVRRNNREEIVRYDVEWRRHRPPVAYDAPFRWDWQPEPSRPDGDWRWPRTWDTGPLNQELRGPARYGLGPYHERLRRRRRSDEELRDDVEDALFYDTWVDADAITVDVQDGIVTLSGELPNYEEVRYATDDAWDIEGVVGVRTELRVAEP